MDEKQNVVNLDPYIVVLAGAILAYALIKEGPAFLRMLRQGRKRKGR